MVTRRRVNTCLSSNCNLRRLHLHVIYTTSFWMFLQMLSFMAELLWHFVVLCNVAWTSNDSLQFTETENCFPQLKHGNLKEKLRKKTLEALERVVKMWLAIKFNGFLNYHVCKLTSVSSSPLSFPFRWRVKLSRARQLSWGTAGASRKVSFVVKFRCFVVMNTPTWTFRPKCFCLPN